MLTFIKKYTVGVLLAILISIVCLVPVPDVPVAADVPLFDKWTHMLMYACFCFVIWVEYWRSHIHTSVRLHLHTHALRLLLLAVCAPIAMSGVLELLQAYATTYRSGEWLDFAANSIGVGIGTALGVACGRHIKAC